MTNRIHRVCVYAASSRRAAGEYYDCARRLGRLLAERGVTVVYGGGSTGSMGALADGALSAGGQVVGVLPRFMDELEWGHGRLTELQLVDTMHERKSRMMQDTDAAIALPGGSGTLEELLEAITWKRLGLYLKPIILVNTRRYYDPLITLLENSVTERLMETRHRGMWTLVDDADDVIPAIETTPAWEDHDRRSASG